MRKSAKSEVTAIDNTTEPIPNALSEEAARKLHCVDRHRYVDYTDGKCHLSYAYKDDSD